MKGFIQNRVTALGVIGAGTMIIFANDHLGAFAPLIVSALGTTRLGITTAKVYERTCRHIDRFAHIDERFFIQVVGPDINHGIFGYCQLQGIYLAAKKYGIENEFFVLKKQHTNNMIPNF